VSTSHLTAKTAPRPRTTVYRPITRTKIRTTTQDAEETPDPQDPGDPCNVPGLEYLCTDSPTDFLPEPTITSEAGCAATDAACLNCGLAYLSQAAAAHYDPFLFHRPFEYQAAALCYQIHPVSSTIVWAPGYYDAPYSYCYDFWSAVGEPTSAYWAGYFRGFCTVMGNVLGVPYMLTAGPTIVAAQATETFGTLGAVETGAAATVDDEVLEAEATATSASEGGGGSSGSNSGSSTGASTSSDTINFAPCLSVRVCSRLLPLSILLMHFVSGNRRNRGSNVRDPALKWFIVLVTCLISVLCEITYIKGSSAHKSPVLSPMPHAQLLSRICYSSGHTTRKTAETIFQPSLRKARILEVQGEVDRRMPYNIKSL
jgi:hypothetical protein